MPPYGNIVKAAKEALTHPADYGTLDSRLFEYWGFTGHTQTRDSDLRTEWNYKTIGEMVDEGSFDGYEKMYTWTDEDWDIEHFSHWACGYGEQFICRILKDSADPDDSYEWTEDDITDIFKFFMEIHDDLEQYPILNEDGYSEYQYEKSEEIMKDVLPPSIDSDGAAEILGYAMELGEYDYDYDDYYFISNEIAYEAAYMLGYQDTDWDEEFWDEWEKDNPSLVIRRKNQRLEEAGQQKMEV